MEQWQSDQIDQLVGALVKAQLKLEPAKKDTVNPYFKKKYADLPTCWDALRCFLEEGIAITQSPMDGPDGYVVIDTQLSHTSGQWKRSRLRIRVAKDDPQGYGSAITYTRRYALGCMTGLVTEEDDDGNAASQPQAKPAMQANKAKFNAMQGRTPAPGAPSPHGAEAGEGGPRTLAQPSPPPVSDLTETGETVGGGLHDLILSVREAEDAQALNKLLMEFHRSGPTKTDKELIDKEVALRRKDLKKK